MLFKWEVDQTGLPSVIASTCPSNQILRDGASIFRIRLCVAEKISMVIREGVLLITYSFDSLHREAGAIALRFIETPCQISESYAVDEHGERVGYC